MASNTIEDWKRKEREFKWRRFAELIAKDPDLSDEQLGERLGLTKCQVLEIRRRLGIKRGKGPVKRWVRQ